MNGLVCSAGRSHFMLFSVTFWAQTCPVWFILHTLIHAINERKHLLSLCVIHPDDKVQVHIHCVNAAKRSWSTSLRSPGRRLIQEWFRFTFSSLWPAPTWFSSEGNSAFHSRDSQTPELHIRLPLDCLFWKPLPENRSIPWPLTQGGVALFTQLLFFFFALCAFYVFKCYCRALLSSMCFIHWPTVV